MCCKSLVLRDVILSYGKIPITGVAIAFGDFELLDGGGSICWYLYSE